MKFARFQSRGWGVTGFWKPRVQCLITPPSLLSKKNGSRGSMASLKWLGVGPRGGWRGVMGRADTRSGVISSRAHTCNKNRGVFLTGSAMTGFRYRGIPVSTDGSLREGASVAALRRLGIIPLPLLFGRRGGTDFFPIAGGSPLPSAGGSELSGRSSDCVRPMSRGLSIFGRVAGS